MSKSNDLLKEFVKRDTGSGNITHLSVNVTDPEVSAWIKYRVNELGTNRNNYVLALIKQDRELNQK